ncbi:putative Ras GTPase-activating-like protein ngap [Psilocybe cubensis]|uniref:Rho GTPase activation protein n=2 Tax=Psilocybe cubensis TaxID=181762 RepID=A0A8H7Y5T3_PSICU|nr:putative Ras GTPase-activating-like protein ngap [Psilocybe cubensis]KAH9486933.1 putative Ras GTPase-activating-like protein ngap [Psilocybe cubensis]
MSSTWDNYPTSSETPREFLVSVELYVSNAAGATLRKPATTRKKGDKRDSAGDDVKLKERASSNWLSLQKGLNGTGQWRPATCRLLEEGERCLLNVYLDESILFQTVYVHLLNQTDIRQADNSLFYRKDCVGIFCIAGQRWTSSHTAEPLYIQFPNADTSSTWQALLKSYAIPEIYGRWFFPMDGGSYRMWRQVELTVTQGRNIGIPVNSYNGHDYGAENDGADVDVSCEIHLNDILCSRTTTKRGLGALDWHESFLFSGLPPFENLEIVVWREKKLSKPAVLGITRIALANFRRGDTVEGWFPVLQTGSIGTEVQFGELRLKIRVDEEIILPYSCYKGLMKTCKSRNFLDWMSDLESRLKLKNISSHLMSIAVATNVVIEQVQQYAAQEVENTSTSQQTLFRGNTTLTKTLELCMTWYGKTFLEASIGTVLRRLCAEKVAIEVDPMRSGKGTRDVERNVEQLKYWCQEFWTQIYSVRNECPNEMRILFKTIRTLVEQRYQPNPASLDNNKNLRWQSVSAFCFLRFIVPAILNPHLFGLCPGLPSVPVQRSLTLIAKVIQSLANLNPNVQKESFMKRVQGFLEESVPVMIDYLHAVSTPVEGTPSSMLGDAMNRHDRLNVVNALRHRTKKMKVLDKEAVPILPHLLDIPKHLAIITSAVIRGSRDLNFRPRIGDEIDHAIDEFCSKCFEVEEEALLRVSQLASKLSSESGRPTNQDSSPDNELLINGAQPIRITEVSGTVMSTNITPNRQRRTSRPATAPSQTPTSPTRRHILAGESSLISWGSSSATDEQESWISTTTRQLHIKAPSTDSVPAFGKRDSPIPIRLLPSTEPSADSTDDPGKRKKGLLRGILRR